ncbi:MAG: 3-mercaptopyruvate sulfurtransferase [Rhodospirillaceae bacterium]|jgi:thiosulfate/3-mercaptopyruvate sulfurtransferase|nr:3-mercaptopyruvate sulfurtransferase [Rhodospirillaceae bacterium]MBT6117468.1 3-mercaptopyruvate sulfurtransferase [Rhodospirillaceae bacterium]
MSCGNNTALVETAWLADHLDAPDVVVVDGSWYLPQLERDPKAEYAEGHIPGAVYFDIDEIADTDNSLPHMFPSGDRFAEKVGALGISNGHHVVVYDGLGLFSAGRVWWMFRAFGHEQVSVLNGGLPKWLAEERPLESGPVKRRPATFRPAFRHGMVRGLRHMRANLDSGRDQVLDARAAGRFSGEEPEIRPGLRGGHIPGSRNLPFNGLVDPGTNTLKDASALKALFEGSGVDLARPVVTTCGSGISACNLALGLHLLGHRDVAIYDGSWTEWGGQDDTPVETGPA